MQPNGKRRLSVGEMSLHGFQTILTRLHGHDTVASAKGGGTDMTTLLVSDFKARCLAVLDQVHTSGETVLVTRRGKPLVRVVPATGRPAGPRKLGALAGEATVRGEIVHAGFVNEWESVKK
jgi:prevent-host-death family protein